VEFKYVPPAYSPSAGLRVEWEDNAVISVQVVGGEVLLRANRAGLLTLAKHLVTLAQEGVTAGTHLHYDVDSGLEEGSRELIVERLE